MIHPEGLLGTPLSGWDSQGDLGLPGASWGSFRPPRQGQTARVQPPDSACLPRRRPLPALGPLSTRWASRAWAPPAS